MRYGNGTGRKIVSDIVVFGRGTGQYLLAPFGVGRTIYNQKEMRK
jgi:hypothetical protein